MDKRVLEADQVREMLKHPGMTVVRRKIAEQRSLLFHQWWRGSAAEADKARDESRNAEAFFNYCKMILLQGKVAAQLGDNNPPSEASASEQGDTTNAE
jgi:hypothetical protein